MASAGIVLIGDEILSGKVVDENARFLVGELRELGVSLRRVTIIPDVLDDIADTVRDFSRRFDHVFTSGGVGPTHDDLTMEGVARAFSRQVIRHAELERLMRAYYASQPGRTLEERNLRMCDVPEGATLVGNEHPSWPVIAVENVYILPGVPAIFRRKFTFMRERFRAAPFFLEEVLTRDEEGHIAAHLDAVVAAFPTVQVGSYPRWLDTDDGGYRVKVTLESKNAADVVAAAAELRKRLGVAG